METIEAGMNAATMPPQARKLEPVDILAPVKTLGFKGKPGQPWTPEQARYYAAKGGRMARQNRLKKVQVALAITGSVTAQEQVAHAHANTILSICDQIKAKLASNLFHNQTKNTLPLTIALKNLYQIWQDLTGHESPAQRRAKPLSRSQTSLVLEPLEPILEPVPEPTSAMPVQPEPTMPEPGPAPTSPA